VYVQTSTIGDLMIEMNVTVYMTKVIEGSMLIIQQTCIVLW